MTGVVPILAEKRLQVRVCLAQRLQFNLGLQALPPSSRAASGVPSHEPPLRDKPLGVRVSPPRCSGARRGQFQQLPSALRVLSSGMVTAARQCDD